MNKIEICQKMLFELPTLIPTSTYSSGGPYGVFAGRDASRGLATFSLNEEAIKDEYDDLSDLNSMQMDSVREWEMQFTGNHGLLH